MFGTKLDVSNLMSGTYQLIATFQAVAVDLMLLRHVLSETR